MPSKFSATSLSLSHWVTKVRLISCVTTPASQITLSHNSAIPTHHIWFCGQRYDTSNYQQRTCELRHRGCCVWECLSLLTHNTHDIILARYLALTMHLITMSRGYWSGVFEGCEGRVQSGIRNKSQSLHAPLHSSLSVSYVVCVLLTIVLRYQRESCVNKASDPSD